MKYPVSRPAPADRVSNNVPRAAQLDVIRALRTVEPLSNRATHCDYLSQNGGGSIPNERR